MPSDGRYMYHQSGINTNYDYAPYPPPPPPPSSSYDNTQINQPPPRPTRSSSSIQPQSPHQPYNPPVTSYSPQNYAPAPYMTQPPQHTQWPNENWAQYNQSYAHPPPPPPPPVEGPYNPAPGRTEIVPSSPMESRDYNSSNHPDPRRMDERQQPHPPPNPPPPPQRRREPESPPAASPGTPTGLDYMKLLESYRSIIDASNLSSGSGRSPPTAEAFEHMMQKATYGAQLLESAKVQQDSGLHQLEVTRSPKRKEPEETAEPSEGTAAAPPKRQKTEDGGNATVQEGQSCRGCNATSTPEWRRGPLGPRTLCNACGLVYAKLLKKRVRERAAGTSNGAPGAGSQGLGESGEDDSDDDDDGYLSPGRSEGARD